MIAATPLLILWQVVASVQAVGPEARLCRGEAGPHPSASPAVAARIDQISWLAGSWVGPTGSEERWTSAASGSMIGVGRTLRKGDMVEFEFLCIVERGGTLIYQAMPGGRMPATEFTLAAIEPAGATFENPAHDFPKRIRYSLQPDGTLEAVTSGAPGSRSITFRFKRQEP
jgi:hypothetical protein